MSSPPLTGDLGLFLGAGDPVSFGTGAPLDLLIFFRRLHLIKTLLFALHCRRKRRWWVASPRMSLDDPAVARVLAHI